MANTRKLQLSFGGGEIDPEMHSRIDSSQYQSGLAKVQNWMVDPKGPLKKRPGFQRVGNAYDSTRKSRLIPFTYSVDQSLAIELSHENIKFHADGATFKWSNPLTFLGANVSLISDTITFDNEHNLVTDEKIVFGLDTSAGVPPVPANLDVGKVYYAIIVGSKTIKVAASASGSALDLTGISQPTGNGYVYRSEELPPSYKGRDDGLNSYQNGGTNGSALGWWGHPSGFYQGQKVRIQQLNPSNTFGTFVMSSAQQEIVYWVDFYEGVLNHTANDSFVLRTAEEYLGTQATPNTFLNVYNNGFGVGKYHIPSSELYVKLVAHYDAGDSVFFPDELANTTPTGSTTAFIVQGLVAHVATSLVAQLSKASLQNLPVAEWSTLSIDGELTVASPYQEEELNEIEYDQSGDVVTLTHPNHSPRDLKRYSNQSWGLSELSFEPSILPPGGTINGIVDRGHGYNVDSYAANRIVILGSPPFAAGDTVWAEGLSNTGSGSGSGSTIGDQYFIIADIIPTEASTTSGLPANNGQVSISVRYASSGSLITSWGNLTSASGKIYLASSASQRSEKYKITSLDVNLQESLPSEEIEVENILAVPGATNTLVWTNATNATTYKIYKEQNGIFGLVGAVDNNPQGQTNFVDDFIGADMSDTLPLQDPDVLASFQPRTVASFEQRRCFAGSNAFPRTLFMSRSGTRSSFTYQIPIQASDRIAVQLASREAHTIRHIVGLRDLIVLTQQGEWRVTAINSDAIGPETIAIRPQSYIGSNKVRPVVVNNKIVFCANRGGHVRELGFQIENEGYLTGDISLRASHLFDGFEITDLAYTKAPTPKLWFVSSSGKLLCLTYVPEEKIMSWQQYVTDGTFESVCAVPEGNFDNIYAVVKRTDSAGDSVRSIERMVAVQSEEREDAVYLDASGKYDGTNTGARTLEIISSGLYKSGEAVSVKANETGVFDSLDVGREIEFTSDSSKYRVRVTQFTSETQVEGVLLSDFPSTLHTPVKTTAWAIATKSISNLGHLANQSISVLTDGVMHKDVTVSAGGTIDLDRAAVKVCAGLKYTCEAQTLPVSLEMEAGGQARTKIINKVYLRVDNSSVLSVGPDSSSLVDVDGLSSTVLTTGEFETHISDSWDPNGQIVIQSTDGLPATVLGLTAQVSLGD